MQYFIRSLKYFVALCVLCTAVMTLNLATGFAKLSLVETLQVMFNTPRGILLPVVIVVVAAFYPKFGFTIRRIEGSTIRHRELIISAFSASGFKLCDEKEGVMTFCAENFIRKLMLLGEDRITVSQQEDHILLDGIRRGVARVEYRLEGYIQRTKDE